MFTSLIAAVAFSAFGLTQTGSGTFAAVRGTVTTGFPQYKPIAHEHIAICSDVGFQHTQADSNGNFVFLTLLPGAYRLYAGNASCDNPSLGLVLYTSNPFGLVANPGTQAVIVGRALMPGSPYRLADCANGQGEAFALSPGIEYQANIDMVSRCR